MKNKQFMLIAASLLLLLTACGAKRDQQEEISSEKVVSVVSESFSSETESVSIIIRTKELPVNIASEEKPKEFDRNAYLSEVKRIAKVLDDNCVAYDQRIQLERAVWWNTWHEAYDPATDPFTLVNPADPSQGFVTIDDALNRLISSNDFSSFFNKHTKNFGEIVDAVDALSDHPEEFDDVYSSLKDFLEAYENLANIAMNFSGEFEDFDSQAAEYEEAATEARDALVTELEKFD